MTDTVYFGNAQAPTGEASHIDLPQYVLVFRDDLPPGEHAFAAISDDAAVDMMRKQYPRFTWALYHVDEYGVGGCFYRHVGPPARGGAAAAPAEAATGGEPGSA